MEFSMVWNIADILMGIMALMNLPVIVLLGKTAFRCLDDYKEQKNQGKNPVFIAKSIGIKEETDFWK